MNFQNGKLAWKRIVNGFFFIRVIRGIRGQQLTGREPLLHFIMIGAAIYLLFGWLGLVRNHLRETVLYRELQAFFEQHIDRYQIPPLLMFGWMFQAA